MESLHAGDPVELGPFRLLGRLGAGGMGQVYLGRDTTGTLAAVKVIHTNLASDPQFRARFAREITTAQRVNAPWTAAVIDADPHGPRPWLATTYIPGPSLDHTVTTTGPLPEHAVAILASRLAHALAALHTTGVIHRDLKPSNVLLADDGPRLIDFGIARAIDSTKITHTGHVIGTPAFMSPEQALGDDADAPSDVFSLAAVLTYAATGTGPFGQTANPVAVLMRIADDDPDLSRLSPAMRAHLGPCFAKDPARRPTAGELATRLAPLDRAGTATAAVPVAAPTFVPYGGQNGGFPGPQAYGAQAYGRAQPYAGPPATRPRSRWRPWMSAVSGVVALGLVVALIVLLARPGAGPAVDPLAAPPLVPLPVAAQRPGAPVTELGALQVGRLPDDVVVAPNSARAYVQNNSDISVIDPAAGAVTATIGVPGSPSGVAVSPDSSRVYVSLLSGFMSVVDATTNTVVASVPVGDLPGGLSVTPDGRFVHVTNSAGNTVSVIDTATNAVVATVPVEAGPIVVSANLDGTLVYVYGRDSDAFSVIDTATNTVVGRIPVEDADTITLAPDGNRAYVLSGLGDITVLDPRAMTVLGEIRMGFTGRPVDVAVSPDSRFLFVGIAGSLDAPNSVRVLDAASTFEVEEVPISVEPSGLGISADGTRLYVASFTTDSTAIVDVGGYAAPAGAATSAPATPAAPPGEPVTLPVGERAADLALAPDGGRVYVAVEEGIIAIDQATSTAIGTIGTGQGPQGVAVGPDSRRAFYPSLDGLEVLDLTTNLVVDTIPKPGGISYLADMLGVSADGNRVFGTGGSTSAGSTSAVIVIDVAARTMAPLVPLANGLPSAVLTADAARLYLGADLSDGSDLVQTVDTVTGAVTDVPGTQQVRTLAIAADGRTLYGLGVNRTVVVDTTTDSVVEETPATSIAGTIAVSPTGAHLFAADFVDGTVTVLAVDDGAEVATFTTGEYTSDMSVSADGRRLYVLARNGLTVVDVSGYA